MFTADTNVNRHVACLQVIADRLRSPSAGEELGDLSDALEAMAADLMMSPAFAADAGAIRR